MRSSGVSQGACPHHIATFVVGRACTVSRFLYIRCFGKQAAYRCIALEMDVEEHKYGQHTEQKAREKHTVELVPVVKVRFFLFRCCELFAELVDVVSDPADVADDESGEGEDRVPKLLLELLDLRPSRDPSQNLHRRLEQGYDHNQQENDAEEMVQFLDFLNIRLFIVNTQVALLVLILEAHRYHDQR